MKKEKQHPLKSLKNNNPKDQKNEKIISINGNCSAGKHCISTGTTTV